MRLQKVICSGYIWKNVSMDYSYIVQDYLITLIVSFKNSKFWNAFHKYEYVVS